MISGFSDYGTSLPSAGDFIQVYKWHASMHLVPQFNNVHLQTVSDVFKKKPPHLFNVTVNEDIIAIYGLLQ